MLDRAPVLFRSSRNLARMGEETIAIRAVDAVDALHQIQVPEPTAVKDKVVRTHDLRDGNREANGLINGQEEINQHKRNSTKVYDLPELVVLFFRFADRLSESRPLVQL